MVVQQPINIGIDASTCDFQLYTGIYISICSSNLDDINHTVLIVGYSLEYKEDYWIVKNSWDIDWRIDEYMCIKRNMITTP